VKLDLSKIDGNAYALLGAFQAAARRSGWSAQEIEAVQQEATSADYNNLVATLLKYTV